MYATVEPEHVDTSHLETLGDGELILLVKSGNDVALGVLLRRHREALYRFCLHLMPNRDDAEDICQESLARAMVRVDSLQSGSAFRSWLFSIARNLSIDSHRSRKRLCALPDEEIVTLPAPLWDESPHDRVEAHEEYQTVAHALGKLKKNHQTVLMLREVEGLSYADIATHLDVSQSAVETLLFRARKRLREEYGKSGSPAPAVAFLGSLRSLLSRLTAPFGGAPLAAKVAVTAIIIGGAAVATPRVLPLVHASGHASTPSGVLGASSNTRAATAVPPGHAARHHAGTRSPGKSVPGATHATRNHSSTRPGHSSVTTAGPGGTGARKGHHTGSAPAGASSPTARSASGAASATHGSSAPVSTAGIGASATSSGAIPHHATSAPLAPAQPATRSPRTSSGGHSTTARHAPSKTAPGTQPTATHSAGQVTSPATAVPGAAPSNPAPTAVKRLPVTAPTVPAVSAPSLPKATAPALPQPTLPVPKVAVPSVPKTTPPPLPKATTPPLPKPTAPPLPTVTVPVPKPTIALPKPTVPAPKVTVPPLPKPTAPPLP